MKRLLLALFLLFSLPSLALGQTNISTTTCPGSGCVTFNVANQGSIGIQITGTWAGTITFQGTVDNVNYASILVAPSTSLTPVSTTTANGMWTAGTGGLSAVRVVFTAYTSGTAAVTQRVAQVAQRSSGTSGGGSGTVTSVDASVPSALLAITGGPITTTGTLAVTLPTRVANTIFGGPSTGADATPTFRALVEADMPAAMASKSYVASAISEVGGGAALSTFLVSGGEVVWQSAYTFTVSAASYYINGVATTSLQQDIALDAAHATLDRIDVIAVDNTGTVVKVTGTAAAQPSEPEVDVNTQLKLGIVLVTAASSEPVGITTELVYAENTGGPGEWDFTSVSTTWNLASTNNPRSGTIDIEATSLTTTASVLGARPSGSIDPNTFDILVLYIRSKAAWNNNRSLQIQLQSTGVLKGNTLTIKTGFWGFDSSITSGYQQIAIPTSQFAIASGTTINQVRIYSAGAGGTLGFYLDDIKWQKGGATITANNYITKVEADALYVSQATAVTASSTTTFTNKTINAESTGNVITLPFPYIIPLALCQNATASLAWSTPVTNPAVAACVTGTNTQYGVAQFADSANLSIQRSFPLHTDFTGAIDVFGKWRTSATSGDVVWQVATICVADAETGDPAFNTASTVTDTAKGTTLQWNDFSITGITITGCAAGEELMLKVFRDSGHGSDTLAATAELISIYFVIRRAM